MKKLLLVALGLVASPLNALALELNKLETPVKTPDGIIEFVQNINNWIFSALLAVAVLFILLAAWEYVTSKGGEGIEKAHKMILYAAIAIVISVLAKGIVFVIAKLAGQDKINPF